MTPGELTRHERTAQGLPPTVADPAVLRRLAVLFTKKAAAPKNATAQEVIGAAITDAPTRAA